MTNRTDVIVVGAGIAGLTCAHALARAGKRVTVLEHNHQAGGLMAGIWRKGYHFDAGDQSFESLGMTLPLLEEMGLPRSRFRRSTYQIKMPGLDTVATSLDALEEAFAAAYPEDSAGLRRVFDVHRRTSAVCRAVAEGDCVPYVGDGPRWRRWARLARRLAPEAALLAASVREEFGPWYRRTMAPGPLRDTLSAAGYSRMSRFVASAFWHLWVDDYWYPVGGYARMWEDLVANVRAQGADVRFKTTVTGLRMRGGRATAVVTASGERLDADAVVWTGDVRSAMLHLLGPERWPRRTVDAVMKAPLSDPLVSLYVGLDLPPEALAGTLRANHLFWFPVHGRTQNTARPDERYHEGQFLEITAHSLEDPTLAPAGRTGLVVQSMTRWDWDAHWGTGGDPMRRAAAYEAAKRRAGDQLLAGLGRLIPGVEDHVVFCDVGTPPSTMRFTRAEDGASCGFQLNLLEYPFKATLTRFTTPVPNVLLAGHGTIWPGSVPMAALSGRIVAQRLLEGYYTRGLGRLTSRLVDLGTRAAPLPGGLAEEPLPARVRTARARPTELEVAV